MMGVSLTLTRLDAELDRLMAAPARSIGLTVGEQLRMDSVSERDAGPVVLDMAAAVVREQAFLSEIDGKIGDGDHGINMGKGFRLAADRLRAGGPFGLAHGLQTLGDTLLGDIGGSMGPLYGTCFTEMAGALEGADRIDAPRFAAMLRAGYGAVIDLGGAKPGDKTLVDVLDPAGDRIRGGSRADRAVRRVPRRHEAGRGFGP